MDDFLTQYEPTVRLVAAASIFLVMALWEAVAPRRSLNVPKWGRWRSNLGLVVVNTVLLRLLFPTAAVGMAIYAKTQGWGLLALLPVPEYVRLLAAIIVLDLAIYLQHVMFHAVPNLWRLHRVHHADLDFDVTTGLRFHPIEIILSMLIKFAIIAALGPPVAAVILFEIILSGMAMFNHSNVQLPLPIDRIVRLFVVTPDMHRVHHSIEDYETNSNFGFNLSLWDRLFGTYKAQPDAGHLDMTIGIRGYRDAREVDRLPGMLTLPFRGTVTGYAINRRRW